MCLVFSVEAYAILQALRWSRRRKQVCHFSFLFSSQPSLCSCYTFLSSVFSSISHSLSHLKELLFLSYSFFIWLQWVPSHSFIPITTWPMSWSSGMRRFVHLQFHVVFLLSPLVFTHFFSRTRGVYRLIKILRHTGPPSIH